MVDPFVTTDYEAPKQTTVVKVYSDLLPQKAHLGTQLILRIYYPPRLSRYDVRLSALVLLTVVLSMNCVAQDRQLVSNGRLLLGTDSNLSAAVRAGDVDNDGDLDLVVANGRHWPQQNMLFLNQSRARFNVARPLGLDHCTSYTCELADLDGDGDLDIAVANDNAPCLVFLNDGHASFVRHCEVGTPSSVRSLTAADIDGDDDVDLIVTCRGRANQIHFNDGKGDFRRSVSFGTNDDSTISVAVADLNEDGHNDLILANRDAQPNIILLATGEWSSEKQQSMFQKPSPFGDAQVSSRAVAVADFNNDGNVDWAVANIGQRNTVYFGNGKGGVLSDLDFGVNDGRTYCLAVADLNNDDSPDIVVGNVGQSNSAYFNTNEGSGFVQQTFGQSDSVTYGLCIGDFTGDGFADVATANSGQPNRIFLNQPSARNTTR